MHMMRRQALAVFLAALGLAAPAGAKDLATSLRGNWALDKLAMLEASAPPFYKMATPEKKKELQDQMLKDMPDMVLEFTATTATMRSGDKAEPASYKVTRSEKTKLWLDFVPQGKSGDTPKVEKYSLEFVDADTVKMLKEGDPEGLLLRRKK
jgi:hypothetical protein